MVVLGWGEGKETAGGGVGLLGSNLEEADFGYSDLNDGALATCGMGI